MRAVLLHVRAALRTGWRSALIVAAIVAVVSATVLALAAGARRTATAPDRYTAASGGDWDGLVIQPSGRPRLDEIASLPAVEHVDGITFVGAWFDGGRDTNPFAGGLIPGARLVSGRAASPDRVGEFVANLAFVEEFDATVGQTYEIGVWTQPQVDRNGLDEPPEGQSFEATLVGIVDGPAELDDPTPSAFFSPAVLESDVGVVTSLMAVQLVPGATRDNLRAQLDSLPDGSELALEPAPIVSASVRNAVAAQAQGLWVITLVAAFAALAAMGQVLSRHARVSELDRRRLVALGASRAQLLGEVLGRAVVPAVGGVLGGALVAMLASGWFPAGFVRRVEPAPGFRPDLVVLGAGLAVLVVALLAWVALASWLGQRTRAEERPSKVVDLVASRTATPAAAAGLRFAFVRSDRESGSVAGTLVGLVIAITGMVAATGFAVSLARLVNDGDHFGANFDVVLGNGWLPAGGDLRAGLSDDADVEGLMLLGAGQARSGGSTVQLVGVEPVRGGLVPRVLSGRMPSGQDELALGRLTANRLGVEEGDVLHLEGAGGPGEFQVVGLAVVPSLGINEGVGEGALLTFEGLQRLQPDAMKSVAAIVLRSGSPVTVGERLSAVTNTPAGGNAAPPSIRNVARVERVPVLLALLLAGLAALTMAHSLVTSIRARRRDLAVLRALGADRRCVGHAVHWQATALAVVPVVLGIPLGLLVGAFVFRAFVDRIGAVPDPTMPLLLMVGVAAGFVGLANVVGLIPARRARRVAPALVLRSE